MTPFNFFFLKLAISLKSVFYFIPFFMGVTASDLWAYSWLCVLGSLLMELKTYFRLGIDLV